MTRVHCPKCSFVGDMGDACVTVTVRPYDGEYCIRCFSAFIKEQCGKLIVIDAPQVVVKRTVFWRPVLIILGAAIATPLIAGLVYDLVETLSR